MPVWMPVAGMRVMVMPCFPSVNETSGNPIKPHVFPFLYSQFHKQDVHFLCVQLDAVRLVFAMRLVLARSQRTVPNQSLRSGGRVTLLRYLQQSDRMTVKASESMSTMITQAFSKAFYLKRPETWTPRRVVDCRRAMTC